MDRRDKTYASAFLGNGDTDSANSSKYLCSSSLLSFVDVSRLTVRCLGLVFENIFGGLSIGCLLTPGKFGSFKGIVSRNRAKI